MESTGIYWVPLYELLQAEGFEVLLVDPSYTHQPGRKTDRRDCQWIYRLHSVGLLAAAFRPDEKTCQLRAYLRQRANLIRQGSRHVQHMQKALEQMNLKLTEVLSDVTGVTGLAILRAISAGERDRGTLAHLRDRGESPTRPRSPGRCRANRRPRTSVRLPAGGGAVDFYHQQIAACDREIEAQLTQFADKSDGQPLPRKPGRRTARRTDLAFDARTHLHHLTGVDLTRLDGIDAHTALKIVGEIGLDITRWPTEKHFASWLGLRPAARSPAANSSAAGASRRPTGPRPPCAWRPVASTTASLRWGPSIAA